MLDKVRNKIDNVQDKETRDQLISAYRIIHDLDISDEAKSKLLDIVDETISRHESLTETYESTLVSVDNLNKAQVRQLESLEETQARLKGVHKHLEILKAILLNGNKRIEA